MVESDTRTVGGIGRDGNQRTLTLPKAWCDGTGIAPGTRLRIAYDRVLVVIPPDLDLEADRVVRILNRHARRREAENLRDILEANRVPGVG
jgi:hypothetical protein